MLQGLGISHTNPIKLFSDSKIAIYTGNNPVFCEITKHIKVKPYQH